MSQRNLFGPVLGFLLVVLISCGGGGGDDTDASGDGVPEPASEAAVASTSAEVEVPFATQAPAAAKAPPPERPTATPVATVGSLFLQLVSPSESEVFTDAGTLSVAGRTRVDAFVTINDTMVEPNIDGEFSLDVPLEEGPNIVEVVSSVASGEQMDLVLVAIYVP